MIMKINAFKIISPYMIEIEFNNGETRLVDLTNELYGEVFQELKNEEYFQKAFLTEWKVIQWPNGADFAPEYLYQISKKKAETLFLSLKQ